MDDVLKIDREQTVVLGSLPTRNTGNPDKSAAEKQRAKLTEELSDIQEIMYGAGLNAVLVIFQGMDASGKDGVIRDVFTRVNPIGINVTSFKVPSEEEADHDFLWREHVHAPRRGSIGVFNRSYYEAVAVERVKHLAPAPVWQARFAQINAFEKILTLNNTIVLKFFLHISRDEQYERLLARIADPTRSWKVNLSDWSDRELWNDYQIAWQEAIGRCASPEAPWWVIPADNKWFRDYAVARVMVETLRPLVPGWMNELDRRSEAARREVEAARAEGRIHFDRKS